MSRLPSLLRSLVPGSVDRLLHAWLLDRRFKPYAKPMDVDGLRFDFWVGDRTGEAWYANYTALSPEMRFVKGMTAPGDVVIEAGAHHGFTTLLLSRWVGDGGRVIALEASPPNAEILARNVALNGRRNVTVVNEAAGGTDGWARLTAGSNAAVCGGRWRSAYRVKMGTLDRYADLRPTLVKLDVEGLEVEVLRGAPRIMALRPKLAIEVHVRELSARGQTPADLLQLLDRERYRLWLQPTGAAEPVPCDGASLASARQVHLYATGCGPTG